LIKPIADVAPVLLGQGSQLLAGLVLDFKPGSHGFHSPRFFSDRQGRSNFAGWVAEWTCFNCWMLT
jgi:hypothetical protein